MLQKIEIIKSRVLKLFESGNFIIFIGIVSILPFLVITVFNHPAADDFCYNTISRDNGYIKTLFKAYNGWTGRYLSTAIMSIRALVSFPFVTYKIIPVTLLTLFSISIYHLSSSIFISLSKREKYILTFLIILLYLIQMPSAVQGFYWLASSITYKLSIILSVFMFSFFIKYLETLKKKYLMISVLFSILVIGTNEISMMFIDLIFGMIFIYTSIKQRKINYELLVAIIFMAAFSLIVVKSPGSASRVTTYPNNQQFLYSFFKTLSATKSYVGDWIPTIILFLFIFFDYFNKNISLKTPKIFNVKLWVPSLIIFSFPFIGFFPIYYSLKWVPLRAVNVIYFFFLVGLIYLAFILYFRMKSKNEKFLNFSKWAKYLTFILILIRLGENNNVRTAYSDLLGGSAYGYDKEMKNRYQAIQNNKEDMLVLPKLKNMPKTIYFEDIRTNPKHWINQCYKSYFILKEIRLKSNKE
jgi:hypothetical protein